jgi:Na+-translocating ferredoxin:NAD+ oxidoreductase subunit G
MNLTARMIVVLTVVGLVSGSFLAVVGMLTEKRIEQNRLEEINHAITEVVPGAVSGKIVYEGENLTVYAGQNEAGNPVGYALYTSGTGFQDIITWMVGIDSAVTQIKDLTILEQKETPGLGAKITLEDEFLRYWEDRSAEQKLELQKPAADSPEQLDANKVNTITGATISSQKVVDIVNHALQKMKSLKQKGHLGSEG